MKNVIFFSTLFAIMAGAGPAGRAGENQTDKGSTTAKTRAQVETLELHVIGMSCRNCADTVEDALAALAGVEVKSVDPASCLATVVYDPSKVDAGKMIAAVNATKEYQVAPTVDYSKLEYENDGSFSLDGKPFTGTAVDAHKNGKQSKSYMFENGLLNGLIREWYENGRLAASKLYKDGKRHGLTQYWDEGGKLTATKLYKNDVHVEEAEPTAASPEN